MEHTEQHFTTIQYAYDLVSWSAVASDLGHFYFVSNFAHWAATDSPF